MDCNSSELNEPAGISTRVDQAHSLGSKPRAAVDELAPLHALAGRGNQLSADHLELHAAQLATRLLDTERQLDRRESEFHAQLARWENELRSQRLKAHERELTLLNREQALDEKQRQVEDKLKDLVAAEASIDRHSELAIASDLHDQREELASIKQQWQLRLQDLDQEERRLQSLFEDLAEQRRKTLEDRTRLAATREEDRLKLEQERGTARVRLDEEWARVQREEEKLQRKHEAVRQMHHDLSRVSREAIEAQLCAEELRASFSTSESESEVMRVLAQLKRKLADEFQLAQQSLSDEKSEVEARLHELKVSAAHHSAQRSELQSWFQRRQDELAVQSSTLVAKERAWADQEANFRCAQQYWDEQRQSYELEIRRLKRWTQIG